MEVEGPGSLSEIPMWATDFSNSTLQAIEDVPSLASPLPHSHQCTLNCRQMETQPILCGNFFFAKIEILRRFVANSAAILALWFLLPLATPYHNY